MTPDQFKAWFEGFCEAIDQAPTPEQWAKIKAKVADLREKPLVNLREPEFKRQWTDEQLYASQRIARGGTASPMPDRGQAIAQNGRATHRVRDLVTGADLGPSD